MAFWPQGLGRADTAGGVCASACLSDLVVHLLSQAMYWMFCVCGAQCRTAPIWSSVLGM